MKDGHRENDPPFSSNAERLSMGEWGGLMLVLVLFGSFVGSVWESLEPFEPPSDYRIPYEWSEDYWLFARRCRIAGESGKSFLIGDSFIWGQFVEREETLSAVLNQRAGEKRFVNAGLDGAHPLALEGLVKHHCPGLRNREVVLHLNLLWLSSPQADLQSERAPRFNHPHLVPQFVPTLPSYQAPISDRIGIVLARHIPVLGWSRHLDNTYFENLDLARWTLENPYGNPFRQITFDGLDSPEVTRPDPEAWFVDGTRRQSPPWVDPETSLQWQSFQRLIRFLKGRGNEIFVLVGPLNEHMLEPSSREVYRETLAHIEAWLVEQNLSHYLPPPLPSHLYGDMSHPLGAGYALLAEGLWGHVSG